MKKISNKLVIVLLSIFLMGGLISSCKKTATVAPPDPIGGFNNSNEIQAAALKAHWTFDGNANESISNTAPTTTSGTSFGPGIKGQALVLSNGYALYPSIAALNGPNLGSITVSCWVKTDNNGSKAENAFALTAGLNQPTWTDGYVNMILETSHATSYDDTLVLHPDIATYPGGNKYFGDNINDYGNREVDFKTVHGTNKWTHYVMRYNGTSSIIEVFANGINVGNVNFKLRQTGNPPVGIGPLVTKGNTVPLIGGFPNSTTGFTTATEGFESLFNGSIDELRFYTAALTDAEISALYQLELVGR